MSTDLAGAARLAYGDGDAGDRPTLAELGEPLPACGLCARGRHDECRGRCGCECNRDDEPAYDCGLSLFLGGCGECERCLDEGDAYNDDHARGL